MTDEQTDEQTDAARLAQIEHTLDWQQCYAAELEAQLAARTRRLEDTDAALVACERSRDQAKDALAERTQALEDACQELADATGSEFTWREQLETAEAALAERTRERDEAREELNRLAVKVAEGERALFGPAPTPHGG